jgi:adenylate cyclase
MSSEGYVAKYEGDAIMAEWGVPYPNPDHAKLACWAALDQQQLLAELRPKFQEEFGIDVHVRMGLNSGTVSAGNMGAANRFSYTVMGDAVNQAARFEPANKDYDTLIMMGETTYQLAKDHVEARLLDKLIVKGKTVPIQIYELVAKKGEISEDKRRVLELYDKALIGHWERDWEGALALLNEALEIIPDDGPSKALIERVESYQESPPPDSWQGEFVRASKD